MSLIDINTKDLCLIDSATTHTILKNAKYFSSLIMQEATISRSINLMKAIELLIHCFLKKPMPLLTKSLPM